MKTKTETRITRDCKIAIKAYLKLKGDADSKQLSAFLNENKIGGSHGITHHEVRSIINNRQDKQQKNDVLYGLRKYKGKNKLDTYSFTSVGKIV